MTTWQREYVRCGKRRCKTCPHGPYWYGYWKENGRTKSKYGGKVHPVSGERADAPTEKEDPREKIFNKDTASRKLALRIMGLSDQVSEANIKARYKVLVKELHPDRGGHTKEMQYVVAAFSYLKAFFK